MPADAWAATQVQKLRYPTVSPGECTLAFDVTKDGSHASISIGHGDLRRPYVQLIEHREHTGWLPARMVELVERWKPLAVGCNGAGPAGAQVGPVLAAFADNDITVDLKQLNGNEYVQACAGFFIDVVEGRLRRPAETSPGQNPIDLAAGDAAERLLGDGWVWDRRHATVPICSLVSGTVARALLPTAIETPLEPMFAYT